MKQPQEIKITLEVIENCFVASPGTTCECFFFWAWEFCIEKWRGFLVIFLFFSGLRFPRNEARKLLTFFGENSEQNSGQNPGQKFEKKIRGTFALQLF